jgi:D-psicose/D-tagatose/L-ribulose 3-epimerase
MKFGAHIYLWTERWSDDSLPLLERAAGLGLDYVELAGGDDVRFSPAPTRRCAEELGLALVMSPGGLWPADCDLASPEPAQRRKGVDWHRRLLDFCGELGAVAYAGAIYGHPGTVDRSRPPQQCRPYAADGLRVLAAHAAERGVRLVVEPMSRFRTHVVNTPAQAVDLIRLAGHPNLGVLFDTWHMVNEVRDYAAAVRDCGDRLWGVHACGSDRALPGGDLVPWQALFGALAQGGFDGYMALETYNTALPGFALSRGVFRDLCPDGDEFVRRGMEFLKAGLGEVHNDRGEHEHE